MKVNLILALAVIFISTPVFAEDIEMTVLSGCILEVSHSGGTEYNDLSAINKIKINKKGEVKLGEKPGYKKISKKNKDLIVKEWLRCKASLNNGKDAKKRAAIKKFRKTTPVPRAKQYNPIDFLDSIPKL